MVRLSVNVNKVATLRNSRTRQPGQDGMPGAASRGRPSVVEATRTCIEAGAHGITLHPRADARHITATDVREVAAAVAPHRDRVELNIEGDPRDDLIALVHEVRPHQFTLVPVAPGELTSAAAWSREHDGERLRGIIAAMRTAGVRTSVFVDADVEAVRWAASLGTDRVELFTEPFAIAHAAGDHAAAFAACEAAANVAHALGLGVNAGHDLDLENLVVFARLPHLDEVSIGHAIIARAVWHGLDDTVRAYLRVLAEHTPAP
jgi:pyridoxine 5-phosphate synthase